MQSRDTAEVIRRFNQAFEEHNPAIFEDLVAPDCVMESIQPAPNGTRYEGYDVNLAFWQAMRPTASTASRSKTPLSWATAPTSAGASISATVARCAGSA